MEDTISGNFTFYPEEDNLDAGQSSFKLPVQGYNSIKIVNSNYASGVRSITVKCNAGTYTIANNKSKTIDISDDVSITIYGYCTEVTKGTYTLSK